MLKRLFQKREPHRIQLVKSGTKIEVGPNCTVLEAALEANVPYPHDCTVGTCGSCRSRLVSGKVSALTPFGYTLSKEELDEGYILACQAMPKSDLEIEVDLGSIVRAKTCSARLVETRNLTHDIKQVIWETAEPIEYMAGQYMKVVWPGAPSPRSYSFSAKPMAGGTTRLTSFIRKVPGGAFTERLFADDLDKVPFEIDAPHGSFWLREGTGAILLIGGGSGLSPLMSILEHAVEQGIERDVILLFGGRAERDLYCIEEISEIGSSWKGRFEFRPVLSEVEAEGIRFGLVTDEIAPAIEDLGSADDLQAYLCGPPGMIDAAIATLSSLDVALGNIHYDKFTDASTAAR